MQAPRWSTLGQRGSTKGAAAGEIDWGEGAGFEITTTETGYESGVVDLSAPSQRRQAATLAPASGSHASKRASDIVANRQLVDDLMELEAFLQTRVGEMGEREALSLLQSMDFPHARLDRDQVRRLREAVGAVLEKLNGPDTHKVRLWTAVESGPHSTET